MEDSVRAAPPGREADVGRAEAPAGERILFVCSSGGHLAQLHALKQWWSPARRLWVTFETDDAKSLLRGEEVLYGHHPTTRNLKNLARNWRMARPVIKKFMPTLIVTTGAGIAVPYFYEARRRGIRTAYLEVIDRIDTPTVTGRMCYPVADAFFVQLPEQMSLYPDAQLVGPVM